jgi:hypothetical protein
MNGCMKKMSLIMGTILFLLLAGSSARVFPQSFPSMPPQSFPSTPSSPGPAAYKPIPPVTVPPPAGRGGTALEKERGTVNPRTGEFYPGTYGGVINPQTGVVLPKVGGGYLNPQTGETIPQSQPNP